MFKRIALQRPAGRSYASRVLLAGLLTLGSVTAIQAADLSAYRDFHFGADLATVAKVAGTNPAEAKLIQSRPSRIEGLSWRPQSLGVGANAEAVDEVVFTFYNGELYQITVQYDRYETAGMTDADLVESVEAVYGAAKTLPSPAAPRPVSYGEPEELVARWEDGAHSFELTRKAYGPTYKLVGVLNRLVAPEKAATLEAARLDELEEPQRQAASDARIEAAETAKLEKARLQNKKKFRP